MKQVIVVDGSLGLPGGKLAAQVAHAAVASFLEASEVARELWLADGMPKVILEGRDADDLRRLAAAASGRGIPARSITDAGKTVVPPGTTTCVGLGPAPAEVLDELTGELKLLR